MMASLLQRQTIIKLPKYAFLCLCFGFIVGCNKQLDSIKDETSARPEIKQEQSEKQDDSKKIVIYQVLPRLFGNKNTTNKPWGTIEENGVGKFNDFDEIALKAIKELGVTHIWYTGVLHHAVIRDYTKFGISNDDPDVVKGRAGSPYAIKDYYNVNPDLAVAPENRLEEFRTLIERTHKQGMKVIIDIVPNHVARNYHSISAPKGIKDFGAGDDKSVVYKTDNNFYYIVGKEFKVPEGLTKNPPLAGESHPLIDNLFSESPAKWTGNNSRASQPDINDWYETVKINFGVSENGVKDFPLLPEDFASKDHTQHYLFWKDKQVPSSWRKFRDIALYWLDFGVDGFRYDMAEMVPVEFWSYFNSAIKNKNPDAYLVAEIYNPKVYRDYLNLGKMDAIYDKVEFYDTLKRIMQNKEATSSLVPIQKGLKDIEQNILHFLENHDEQRIASSDFVGDAEIAKPAMVVSAMINSGPIMLYFAQEHGEPGEGSAGFGGPTRSSIFDYWGVPSQQRFMNQGKFDGGQSTGKEKALRDFYARLLNFTADAVAVTGNYEEIHSANKKTKGYDERLFSFVRWTDNQRLIVISNFDSEKSYEFQLTIPKKIISQWEMGNGEFSLIEQLYAEQANRLKIKNGSGSISIKLKPLQSFIYQVSSLQGDN